MKSQEKTKEPIGNYVFVIATIIGAVLMVFAFNFLYANRLESTVEYFDDSVEIIQDHIKGDIKQLRWEVQQLRREVREVRETFQKWEEVLQKMETLDTPTPSAGLFEDSDPNLSLDSVPCCGGEDNVTNFESIQSLPEDVSSFQEALAHVRANLPEEQRLQMEELDRKNEEFFNTLDEAGLAELERRKQEFKGKMRSQFTTMMAAMPEQIKQNWKKNKHLMEQSWETVAHTTTLMDMRTDYELSPSQFGGLKIEMLKIEKNTDPQLTEEWKIQEALRQLEEAARQQE